MLIYGEKLLWVRPYRMFTQSVLINGEPKPRFQLLD
ncbi:hypothetical protein CWE08_07290 [Aliidiomarina iranensis]|uniref:DUF1653 domain-containing protein n=1 Tax=Aliidiomarina iranensis TaxID=1434071 RepID=A0A432VWG0_9GAMM|nr:hypothetical protein CWE08_07290 [Aliidiomarina iranensis]